MSFLPDAYKEPVTSNYMKLVKGENRFRVLGRAVVGWEWWEDTETGGRKPIRVHMTDRVPSGTDTKHFWAFPVWNYADGMVQILEITQKSIQKFVKSLADDKDWGDPKEYDIVVTRNGDGLETEYIVKAKPHKKVDEEIQKTYKETPINLEAFYTGDDPFAVKDEEIDISEVKL